MPYYRPPQGFHHTKLWTEANRTFNLGEVLSRRLDVMWKERAPVLLNKKSAGMCYARMILNNCV